MEEPMDLLGQMRDEIDRWSEFYGIEFSAKEGSDLAKMLYGLVKERDKKQNNLQYNVK